MSARYETITIDDIAHFPRPGTSIPMRIGFTPDGKAVTYLASAEGNLVLSLFVLDIATGTARVLAGPPDASTDEEELSREEQLRRERARLRELGVTSYQFAREAQRPTLLIPSGGSLQISLDYAEPAEIPGTKDALDARLSRDGRQVAFVRDGELHVAAVPEGNVRQLTSGAEDGLTHGVAEFIAAEELDRSEGFWWSPDGTKIAFVRADSRHIPNFPIVHQGAKGVDVENHRYPFAGEANTCVELGVIDIETGDITWMNLGADSDIYLARVHWRPDGVLTAQWLSRDQTTLRLISFDAGGSSTLLHEEQTDPWLNLHNDLRFLDSGEFVWTTEQSGYRHLWLHRADGRPLRELTSGEWVVTRLVSVDEQRRLAYFEATLESVLERHLYRVPLDGGEIEKVTTEHGWHSAVVSRSGDHFVDVHSTREHGAVVTLRPLHSDGPPQTIFANENASAAALGLVAPEFMQFEAADGTLLHGAYYAPPGTSGPVPLIVSVYGGPHAQRVMDEWTMTVDLRAQYLARQGFGVLKLDNRGSAHRGLAFEAPLHRRMGTVEVEDHATAVRALVRRGIADGNRVGIFGWSYGGYMTCLCLMLQPELFKVGVAGAPVTDWDGYDTGYTERYMSTPRDNPDGYRNGSALTHAHKLEGKLMLVHGGVDENVHFRHTARLAVALTDAQKDFDLLLFPEERHMPRDAKGLRYQERRLVEYFQTHL